MSRQTQVQQHKRSIGFNRITTVRRHLRRLSPFNSPEPKREYLFTYGNLMKDRRLHFMLNDQLFITEYTLEDHKRIWPEIPGFPIVVQSVGHSVEGEIYHVDLQAVREISFVETQAGYEIRKFTTRLPKINKLVSVKYYYPKPPLKAFFENIIRKETGKIFELSQKAIEHHKDLQKHEIFSMENLWERMYSDLNDRSMRFLKTFVRLIEESNYEDKDSLASLIRDHVENPENYDEGGFFRIDKFFERRLEIEEIHGD